MYKLSNNKHLTNNRQHNIGGHGEQPLLFSLVHLILCWALSKPSKIRKGELK